VRISAALLPSQRKASVLPVMLITPTTIPDALTSFAVDDNQLGSCGMSDGRLFRWWRNSYIDRKAAGQRAECQLDYRMPYVDCVNAAVSIHIHMSA